MCQVCPRGWVYRWEVYPEVATATPRYWQVGILMGDCGEVIRRISYPYTLTYQRPQQAA